MPSASTTAPGTPVLSAPPAISRPSSVAVIVSHWKKLEARGGKLMLAGAQHRYIRALWITGLASRMSLYDDVETAIAAAGTARTASSGD